MKETLIISLMLALSYHVSAQDRVGYTHDPAAGMFTQVDPLCEQYPHLNPYLYCAGNPVRYVDPDGRKFDLKSLSDKENKDYLEHITLLRAKSSLFDNIYRTLEDSKDIYNVRYSVFQSSMGTEGKGRFIANEKGGGEIEFGKNKINEIDMATYIEEVFHAYQHENRQGYEKGEFNREFEAKTFVTIAGNETDFYYPVYPGMDIFQGKLYDYSYKGIKGIISPSMICSPSFVNQYMKFANIFADYNKKNKRSASSYVRRTTINPYSLQKIIKDTYR